MREVPRPLFHDAGPDGVVRAVAQRVRVGPQEPRAVKPHEAQTRVVVRADDLLQRAWDVSDRSTEASERLSKLRQQRRKRSLQESRDGMRKWTDGEL